MKNQKLINAVVNSIKSESIAIAEAIASALGARYYDTEVVGNETEAILCTHYDVDDAEWPWQNGCRTRFIRVVFGVIELDVDDYFESAEQESLFSDMTDAYARLCPPPVIKPEAHDNSYVECEFDDEDIPF